MASKRKRPAIKPSKPKKRTTPQKRLTAEQTRRSAAAALGWKRKKERELRKSQASRKGWETRRKREASYREVLAKRPTTAPVVPLTARVEPAELTEADMTVVRSMGFEVVPEYLQEGFSKMARLMSRYGETQDPTDYDYFRELKRTLYSHFSPEYAAQLTYEACIEAGWDEIHAEQFSRLS